MNVDVTRRPEFLDRLKKVHTFWLAVPAVLGVLLFLLWVFRVSSPTTIVMPDTPTQPAVEQVVVEVWPDLSDTLPYPLTVAAQRMIGADPSSPCMADPAARCILDRAASGAVQRELLSLPPGFDICGLDMSWDDAGHVTLDINRSGPAGSVPLVDCTAPGGPTVPIPADGSIPAVPADVPADFEGE